MGEWEKVPISQRITHLRDINTRLRWKLEAEKKENERLRIALQKACTRLATNSDYCPMDAIDIETCRIEVGGKCENNGARCWERYFLRNEGSGE